MADSSVRCLLRRGPFVHRVAHSHRARVVVCTGDDGAQRRAGVTERPVLAAGPGMSDEQMDKALQFQLSRRDTELARSPTRAPEDFKGGEQKRNFENFGSPESDNVQRRVSQTSGTLTDDQFLSAIQRQVGATHASWDEEDFQTPSLSADEDPAPVADPEPKAPEAPEPEPAEDKKDEACAPSEEFDDGTVVYTAEKLEAVDYDDILDK